MTQTTELTPEQKAEVRRLCGYPPEMRAFDGWSMYDAIAKIRERMDAFTETDTRIATQYLSSIATIEEQAKVAHAEGSDRYDALLADWRLRLCGWIGVLPGPMMEGITK